MDHIQESLRKRYFHLHPLLFLRSVEKAKTNGELFDILEGVPDVYPIMWDDEARCWKTTKDLLQSQLAQLSERNEK